MDDSFRVQEVAEAAGVSVDTVRYYQHRGLLPAPERRGRVAFYSPSHVARLKRIAELKSQGLPLDTIGRVLSGADPSDAILLSAVAGSGEARLSLDDVAEAAGVPVGLLESLATEGLLLPRAENGEQRYSQADVRAVRAGLTLLEAGVPLSALLGLGRRYSESVDGIAEEAVSLFNEYVRKPALEDGSAPAAEQVLEAFNRLLPAASALVRHNFERAVLAAARRRIGEKGSS